MIKRKKILLNSKDVSSRELRDFEIVVQLNRTTNNIISNVYENSFDILKHYNKERNNCRNFRIYGTIESGFFDCDSLILHVFSDLPQNVIEVSNDPNYILTINVKPLISNVWENKNIFNLKKGKYLIELDNYKNDFVYIYIEGSPIENSNNLIKKQLIYRYDTINILGEQITKIVPFGTNESIVDINGNILVVNNDFEYFYNKHWINENIQISLIRDTEWIGDENFISCVKDNYGNNTGYKHYEQLKEIYVDTGKPTGVYKPNDINDTDYINDIMDTLTCQI